MPKKEAIEVYAPEWLTVEETLPSISYSKAAQFFYAVCELKGIKNITIRQNLRRKGAICIHRLLNNTHRIEVGKISPITEMLVLHEIAHSFFPHDEHGYRFVSAFENLMKEFLPNKVMERWLYYRSKIGTMRTVKDITKFYHNRLKEIKKPT